MSEVHWSEPSTQAAEERRQTEKSESEKRTSKAKFEKKLQQDRSQKTDQSTRTQQQNATQHAQQEARTGATREEARTQEQQQTAKPGQAPKKDAKKTDKKESAVLAHVRAQAGQQAQARGVDKRMAMLGQQAALATHQEMEKAAQGSAEGKAAQGSARDGGLTAGKAQEKSKTRELQDKERVKEAEAQEVRREEKVEANNQQAQVQAAQVSGANQQIQVEADGQRRQQQQQQQQQQGGGGQAQAAQEAQAARAPSQSAIARANKAQEIQKLCEKLLDTFYMGAAPDGSAMMRMELKDGVLSGLIIELNVDDKRNVKLTLSGGNKEAIDFVTSSRGELSRALSRKGLNLATVDSRS